VRSLSPSGHYFVYLARPLPPLQGLFFSLRNALLFAHSGYRREIAMEFQIGDKVRFKKDGAGQRLMAGEFIVRSKTFCEEIGDLNGKYVRFEEINGGWYEWRFELVEKFSTPMGFCREAAEEYEEAIQGIEILSDILKDKACPQGSLFGGSPTKE
jgi:hypothetical protein